MQGSTEATLATYLELDITGGTCTGCSIGIEHMGRRIKGVEEIHVNRQNKKIELTFDGNPATVEKITQFVRAIGYDACLSRTPPPPAD